MFTTYVLSFIAVWMFLGLLAARMLIDTSFDEATCDTGFWLMFLSGGLSFTIMVCLIVLTVLVNVIRRFWDALLPLNKYIGKILA